jgi:hypothetical protein
MWLAAARVRLAVAKVRPGCGRRSQGAAGWAQQGRGRPWPECGQGAVSWAWSAVAMQGGPVGSGGPRDALMPPRLLFSLFFVYNSYSYVYLL